MAWIYKIDISTGKLGEGVPLNLRISPTGIRQDPRTGIVYLWENSLGQNAARLFTVDVGTGELKLVGNLGSSLRMVEGELAFSPFNGTCYACWDNVIATNTQRLVTLNLSTGAASVVGAMSGTPEGGPDYNGLDFDPTTGRLWAIGATRSGVDQRRLALYSIEPSTGVATIQAKLTPEGANAGNVGTLGMAFDSSGTLYFSHGDGLDSNLDQSHNPHVLARFTNLSTAEYSVIGYPTGLPAGVLISGLAHIEN